MSQLSPYAERIVESRVSLFVKAAQAADPVQFYDTLVRPEFEGLDDLAKSHDAAVVLRVEIASRIARNLGPDGPILRPFLSLAPRATATEASQIAAAYGSHLSGPDFNVRAAARETWNRLVAADGKDTAARDELVRAVSILSVGAFGRLASTGAPGVDVGPAADLILQAFQALRDAWIDRRDFLRKAEEDAQNPPPALAPVSFADLAEFGVRALDDRPVRIRLVANPDADWDGRIIATLDAEIVFRLESGTILVFPRAAVIVQAQGVAAGFEFSLSAPARRVHATGVHRIADKVEAIECSGLDGDRLQAEGVAQAALDSFRRGDIAGALAGANRVAEILGEDDSLAMGLIQAVGESARLFRNVLVR